MADEIAIELVAAADLLGLPRLSQIAEQAMQPVRNFDLEGIYIFFFVDSQQHVDAESAVEVYIAVSSFNAPLLKATCMDWMAAEIDEAREHKQWPDLGEAVQTRVKAENAKLLAKREELRKLKVVWEKLPCLLAP